MTLKARLLFLALVFVQALVGPWLTSHWEPAAWAEAKLQVVASIRPVALLVQDVGGDAVEVSTLLAPGVDLHHFELKPSQRVALMRAGLVVLHGAGVETWANGLRGELGGRLVELFPPGLAGGDEAGLVGGQGAELGEGQRPEPVGGQRPEPVEGQRPELVEGSHYWLSPNSMVQAVPRVADKLCAVSPQQCEGFRARSLELVEQLKGLDRSWRQDRGGGQESSSRRNIWLSHPLYGQFAQEYGFVQKAVNLQCESSVISPAEMQRLYKLSTERPANLLFIEAGSSRDISRILPSSLELRLVELDSMGLRAKTLLELLKASSGQIIAEMAASR